VFLLAAICLLGGQKVDALSYYVAVNGLDSNSGTASLPFRTITRGIAALKPGDILLVGPGTYAESLRNIPAGSSWTSAITIKAATNQRPVLRPPNGADRVLSFSGAGQQFIILDGFVLDAVNITYEAVKITGGAHHIRVQNCEILNSPNHGILITGQASIANELVNLDIHHNGSDDFDHGIYISTSSNLVDRCSIHHNSGWGVHVYAGEPFNHGNLVRGNKFFENGVKGRGAGIGFYTGFGQTAVNNLIWNNNGGIYLDYGAHGAKLYHNTLYLSRSYGIQIGSGSSTNQIANNIVAGSGNHGIYITSGSRSSTIRNNLLHTNRNGNFADPGKLSITNQNYAGDTSAYSPAFVNAAAFDFRLSSTSAAIGRAFTLSEVPVDFGGAARPTTARSIGAFEYVATSSSLPSGANIGMEAEDGLVSSPMAVAVDAVTGVSYISSATPDAGRASYNLNISTPGNYLIWARIWAAKSTADSVYVSMDQGTEDIFDMAQNTWTNAWQWNRVNGRAGGAPLTLNPRVFYLTAGQHTLHVRGREPGARIDRLILTTNASFVPGSSMSGWVDAEEVAPPEAETPILPQVVPQVLQAGVVKLSVQGLLPADYLLQITDKITRDEWRTIQWFQPDAEGAFEYTLPLNPGLAMQFYRVVRL
jgi:hypothetical protein